MILKTENKMKNPSGDGVADDTKAIQSLLDSGQSTVYLPPPAKHYVISKSLRIHSNQSLVLDLFSEIRLAAKSDCLMITNSDHAKGNENIAVVGGIWNMDNRSQSANPIMTQLEQGPGRYDPERFLGICMRFVGVTHFTLKSVTFRDPVTFCTQFARMRYFTIEDITFDFRHWNPLPINMDGIHLDGHCQFGKISNLRGATNDDLIALNADDIEAESPCFGPIEDISIDGIYAEDCHSAIRFLSSGSPVRRISVSNVFGSYYQYAFGFTKFFHRREGMGVFDEITFRDIHCAKAPRHSSYQKDDCPEFPLIWCERGTRVGRLTVADSSRLEESVSAPWIQVDEGAEIGSLIVQNASSETSLSEPVDFLVNEGFVGNLTLSQVSLRTAGGGPAGSLLRNRGRIDHENVKGLQ
jgi:hypothetical protein